MIRIFPRDVFNQADDFHVFVWIAEKIRSSKNESKQICVGIK